MRPALLGDQMSQPTWLWWSSGKDSAWTLGALATDPRYQVTGLVTTVNTQFDRIAIHGVRRRLLQAQASALDLPLRIAPISYPCPNGAYEDAVDAVVAAAVEVGVRWMAFGDLYLEDIRVYREGLLAGTGIQPVFPLWGKDTQMLGRDMIEAGMDARVTCVDSSYLPAEFAGRRYDLDFLADLPDGVDACGENGEFHTFVCEGPLFAHPIQVRVGDRVTREGFVFCDLTLAEPD